MAEDRTLEPSGRRLLLAREQGQVARSPELTAAVTLLAAAGLLAVVGEGLGASLVALVRAPWLGDLGVGASGGRVDLIAHVRTTVGAILGPVGAILGGSALVAVLVHQGQVGGLLAPGLLAPDPGRLWHLALDEDEGSGDGPLGRAGRGVWGLAKALVIALVVAWLITRHLGDFARLGRLDAAGLIQGAGVLIRSSTLTLALALLALGAVDYALQRQRLASRLRMTAAEQRADLRSSDGDPALRARRRALAKARAGGGDAPELLRGASLVVTGPGDIAIVLAGGPPPRRVSLRQSARGASGAKLQQAALRHGLPHAHAPDLALALAQLRTPAVPASLLARLSQDWPVAPPDAGGEAETGGQP